MIAGTDHGDSACAAVRRIFPSKIKIPLKNNRGIYLTQTPERIFHFIIDLIYLKAYGSGAKASSSRVCSKTHCFRKGGRADDVRRARVPANSSLLIFCPLILFLLCSSFLRFLPQFSPSFIIFPLRSSSFLFVHHFSSSFIIFPLRSSFLLFLHHFSSSFIIFPLRSSLFLFVQVPAVASAGFWVSSPFARQSNLTPSFPLSFFLFVHPVSSSFMISPLRSSFCLFVHHFSSSFIISPLRSSFLLFVHHFSSSFIIFSLRSSLFLFVQVPPVTSAG